MGTATVRGSTAQCVPMMAELYHHPALHSKSDKFHGGLGYFIYVRLSLLPPPHTHTHTHTHTYTPHPPTHTCTPLPHTHRCFGYRPQDYRMGSCSSAAVDQCSCDSGFRCLPKRRVCLSSDMREKCDQFSCGERLCFGEGKQSSSLHPPNLDHVTTY